LDGEAEFKENLDDYYNDQELEVDVTGDGGENSFGYQPFARPYTPLKMENNQSTGFFKVIFVLKLNNNRYTKPQTKDVRASNQSY
jgi:hypothetical protein